jgi:hypothetical protein
MYKEQWHCVNYTLNSFKHLTSPLGMVCPEEGYLKSALWAATEAQQNSYAWHLHLLYG